eukprot:365690-Chlamydomonas_euryale.AAC.9
MRKHACDRAPVAVLAPCSGQSPRLAMQRAPPQSATTPQKDNGAPGGPIVRAVAAILLSRLEIGLRCRPAAAPSHAPGRATMGTPPLRRQPLRRRRHQASRLAATPSPAGRRRCRRRLAEAFAASYPACLHAYLRPRRGLHARGAAGRRGRFETRTPSRPIPSAVRPCRQRASRPRILGVAARQRLLRHANHEGCMSAITAFLSCPASGLDEHGRAAESTRTEGCPIDRSFATVQRVVPAIRRNASTAAECCRCRRGRATGSPPTHAHGGRAPGVLQRYAKRVPWVQHAHHQMVQTSEEGKNQRPDVPGIFIFEIWGIHMEKSIRNRK